MKWVNLIKIGFGLAATFTLAACIGIKTTMAPPPAQASVPSTPVSPAAPTTLPATPAPTRTAILIPPNPTVEPATETIFQPCSPLVETPLLELPEIVSDPYHPPPMGKDERHQGVDFSYYRRGERLSIEGAAVQSILAGKVVAAVADSFPFGNHIILETLAEELPPVVRQQFSIQPGESLYILYAHMEAPPEFELGEVVLACQQLGTVGKTGNAGVAHLHLEMRHGATGAQFPSMGYYKPDDTPDERANYLRWATGGEFLHFDPLVFLSYKP